MVMSEKGKELKERRGREEYERDRKEREGGHVLC